MTVNVSLKPNLYNININASLKCFLYKIVLITNLLLQKYTQRRLHSF